MEEVKIKSHLIVKDVHEEYSIEWKDSIINTKPKFKNNMLIFQIRGNGGRCEVNTMDIKLVEKMAKKMSKPKGRQAVTTDVVRISIEEEDGNEKLIGLLTHNHVKTYAPMYDNVYWR